jgi:hypothetical protein
MRVFVDSAIRSKTLEAVAKVISEQHYSPGAAICTIGEVSPAALYIVRSGKVEITTADGTKNVYEHGAYFGIETLMADSNVNGDNKNATVQLDYTATAVENSTCGVLTLKSLRKIVNTENLGKKGASMDDESISPSDIKMSDLKTHALLGAGTFGQVWLVSRPKSSGSGRRAYAMKVQSKYELCKDGQANAVSSEREIMDRLQHPFIISLVRTFQDKNFIYMLMAIAQGGELYSYIHTPKRDGVPESHAKFYAACISEALCFMHRLGIVYRDLKPENVLIDGQGYCVLVDMGFAKYITDKTYTLCGTPLYIAPE